jgi:hypothetical protein
VIRRSLVTYVDLFLPCAVRQPFKACVSALLTESAVSASGICAHFTFGNLVSHIECWQLSVCARSRYQLCACCQSQHETTTAGLSLHYAHPALLLLHDPCCSLLHAFRLSHTAQVYLFTFYMPLLVDRAQHENTSTIDAASLCGHWSLFVQIYK